MPIAGLISISYYLFSLIEVFPGLAAGRTNLGQARRQLAALVTTLGVAIVGGLLTGQHFSWDLLDMTYLIFFLAKFPIPSPMHACMKPLFWVYC